MKNHIAAAFQNTVDFELKWDTTILESLIRQHRISQSEIQSNRSIQSERDLIITLLAHMTEGSGSECLAASSQITRSFASHFPYDITLGGTAVRAAMAIEKIGYRSTIHACSLNRHFCRLIPEAVSWVSGMPDEGDDFHPHVIVQYPADIRIHINDIDFTTRNPNRVIFTYDPPSMRLEISDAFAEELSCANVFLIASYNIIKDKNILKNRLQKTLSFINALPPLHTVIMEDGRFEDPHMRKLVTETLAPQIDIFSMNEDELQDRFGCRINILNPAEALAAIQTVYNQLQVPTLVCHTSHWALSYGRQTPSISNALKSGICMASTRFQFGDDYNKDRYKQSQELPASKKGAAFCESLSALSADRPFYALPAKDLSSVARPHTIGLGDAFIGGMLPQLLPESAHKSAYI